MNKALAKDFERFYRRIRKDVFALCEALNFIPTWQQREILVVYQRGVEGDPDSSDRRQTVKSGQGGGKTAIENIIALHWVLRHYGARMRILATSIDQLKDTWMAEFRQLVEGAEPIIQQIVEIRTKDVLVMGHPDWGIRMIPAKESTKVRGRHHKHLGFIIDECSGIERGIFDVVIGTLKNPDRYFGIFGNPHLRDNFQWDTFNVLREYWWSYTINVEESPIADKQANEQLEIMYGRDSDMYRVNVLGEFPDKNPEAVMSSDDLEACVALGQDAEIISRLFREDNAECSMGIDFARKGNDASVIAARTGYVLHSLKSYNKQEPLDVVGYAYDLQSELLWRNDYCRYVPDADGMGGGAMGAFRGKLFYEFHAEGTSRDPWDMYDNAITEAYFHLGLLVKARRVVLPNDPVLLKNLSTRNYATTKKGKIRLESKDEWRKRIGSNLSPDKGDAVVLAFYPRAWSKAKVASLGPITSLTRKTLEASGKILGLDGALEGQLIRPATRRIRIASSGPTIRKF